ncbi:MAG: GntR family transcriptional regulator [Xanthomonadales bacterium]
MNRNRQSVVSPDSLAERAYHLLEEKLVTLALPPGAMVSERELIEMIGLGRTPVREAIQRLAHQRFFDILPRRGLLVTLVTRSGMLHILEARKPLERLIIYRASLKAGDVQRSDLAAIARGITTTHDRFEEFLKMDHKLDKLLDACAGNPFAAAAVSPLRGHCRRLLFFRRQGMRLTESISANSKMARLVARREFRGAQKASDGRIAVLERAVSNVGLR